MSAAWTTPKPRKHSGILPVEFVIDAGYILMFFGVIILIACVFGGNPQ